ncbi:ABC transporter ATP-binding protein [Paenibacillus camelliae]|uniref:ABC transporter ATP-binding protein n=1 Tax=Paenibacillus camelliae TaxID=512410 RepID=UPI00203C4D08|nr:ABC transporter ATP-binding protein [Paenibacillus camelliae]MCM3633401.1 ABC transporter ATP-binding protein/permease [Paenibacillus camelliae]
MNKESRSTALNWTYQFSKPYLWSILLLSIIGSAVAGGFILIVVVSSYILDIATGAKVGVLTYWIILLFIMIVLLALLQGLASHMRTRIAGKLEMNLRQTLFIRLTEKQYMERLQLHSGDMLHRLYSDVQLVVNGVVQLIPQFISMATKLIVGFIVMVSISPIFSVAIISAGVLMYTIGRLYRKKYKGLHKACQSTEGHTRSFLQECFENIVLIKSYCREQLIHLKLQEKQQTNYNAKLARNMVTIAATSSSYLMLSIGYFAVLVWGAMQLSAGSITFGSMLALLQMIDQVKGPFRNMSGLAPQYYAMLASAERLQELEQLNDEPNRDVINQSYISAAHMIEELEAIELDQVSYRYGQANEVLHQTSFTINKGEFVGIAGASGAGKSTLFKLILGFIQPDSGELRFRMRKGNVLNNMAARLLLAYVPQIQLMFSGTIRENLTMFNEAANDTDINDALNIACLSEEIAAFPHGLDTMIGEHNVGLSEGQAQRLSIARAVLSKAPILLLDESTSALNESLEKEVLRRLRTLQGRTVIFISHSTFVLKSCDRVISLDALKHGKELGHGA